jgi:type II secretory pathway pseudopilin PulG
MSLSLPHRPPFGASRGYTAIEVMLAITVLMIGSASVMSMQKASMLGNLDARKLDIANSIAHDWIERLTADAAQWTLPTTTNPVNNINNTTWLQYFTSPGSLAVPFLPALPTGQQAAEAQSPAFDILGRGLTAGEASNAQFCVHLNIVEIAQDAQANTLLLRATVMVFWPKFLAQSGAIPATHCTQWFDVAAAESTNPGTWHIIYASTAIRKNPLQGQ